MNEDKRIDRPAAIRAFMGVGFSREDADTMVDLTAHGLTEAEQAIMRIVDTAPVQLRLMILANIAHGLAASMATLTDELKRRGAVFQELQG